MMSRTTYFYQECPTCGRTLQVRVDYLGKEVVCQHCRGAFEASDPESGPCSLSDSALIRRADELLEQVAQHRRLPR